MVGPPKTCELRIRVIDCLSNNFAGGDDLSRLAQAACKKYLDKIVRVTKRFNDGDMVFLQRPKHKPKIAKERDEHIAKLKLLPRATGPYIVIRAYSNVIFLDIE